MSDKKNPLQFPVYLQTFYADFESEAAARTARAEIQPLPYGKRIAFTSRWDDSNPRHLKQSQVLAKNGWRGSYFLNAVSADFAEVMKQALSLGMSVGNHGTNHPFLTSWNLNALFRQIVIHQAEIESALDTTSVSFTIPCSYSDPAGLVPDRAKLTGELLERAGIYSFPEWLIPSELFRRDIRSCFGTNLFFTNDRNPDENEFRKGISAAISAAESNPDCPRVTFGVHTWQSDEGFELLDKLYAEFGHLPHVWYCNENEYAAYHYLFYHASIRKTRVEGKRAWFEIERPEPASLGAAVPLCLKFNVPATAGEGCGLRMQDDILILPDSGEHQVPVRIAFAENGTASDKIPGVIAKLSVENGIIRIRIENHTNSELKNLRLKLAQPIEYINGVLRQNTATLPPNDACEFTMSTGEKRFSLTDDAPAWIMTADFVQNGETFRLYTVYEPPFTLELKAVPRDTLLGTGPFPPDTVKPEMLKDWCNPRTELLPLGAEIHLKWRQLRISGMSEYAFCPIGVMTEDQYKPFVREPFSEAEFSEYCDKVKDLQEPGKGEFLFAVDFDNEDGGEVVLAASPKTVNWFLIDGKRIDCTDYRTVTSVTAGKHRLFILMKTGAVWAYRPNAYWLGIYRRIPDQPLSCIEPPFRNRQNGLLSSLLRGMGIE